MFSIQKSSLPASALLNKYSKEGIYTDCYTTGVPTTVALTQYVAAFYTTPIFKLERFILKWAVSRPSSTDADAKRLAAGETDTFAAWQVEERSSNQLLMSDFQGRTRSWLMVEPNESAGAGTRLYFGSAVVPATDSSTLPLGFSVLLGFHKIYSEVLLVSARLHPTILSAEVH